MDYKIILQMISEYIACFSFFVILESITKGRALVVTVKVTARR